MLDLAADMHPRPERHIAVKREIAEIDEKLWAQLKDAHTLPVEISLQLLKALHQRWVALLASLTDEDWKRGYVHSENGRQTLGEVLQSYDWHCRHHIAHVTELRKRMGW